MKKVLCALLAMALLCGAVVAEAKTVRPMSPGIDPAAPADGVYPVAFQPADLSGGVLKLTIYAEDCYDIAELDALAVGDILWAGGEAIAIESLERDGGLVINGGIEEDGFYMLPFEEDNCWKMYLLDGYPTYTECGGTALPLADDATFTDGWDIAREPVTAGGAEAVAAAVNGTDMEDFIPYNTTVRVEGGRIVEIFRDFIP